MNGSSRPVVSVVIVTYNSDAVVHECLNLLGADERIEVLVIDNLSSDGTVGAVRTRHPHVTLIENEENAGFAKAVNKAAAAAAGRHILLLNPDALIDSESVLALAARLDDDPGLGAISPLVGHEGTDVRVIAAGHAPTIWRMLLHQTGLSRLGSRVPLLEGHYLFRESFGTSLREVDWVSGGCVMVPQTVWRSAGALTERWFMYAEDVEFCLRLRSLGWRIAVDPRVTAHHEIGGSSAGVDGRVTTAWIENLFDLYSWRMARWSIQVALWKGTVLLGFGARRLFLGARALLPGAIGERSRAGAHRFRVYARGLQSARPSRVREPFTRSSNERRLAGGAR
ncbi:MULTISPECIES: glycosyltransferase family 2 protein [unclassified Rathayibacter]|uniref:glycosyltransferase family 2 protein n=1 Tax=unclassified Rathayibacter TaxID=2609250 RepID=UPI00188C4A26|nr:MULTISPECIES: glycosyltransferase [unclassified Rathayibacter]MBF4463516.1 glycosyltransferase [Rathayibacter sp. VKM Ac-2879]MBF4504762.1 glycosyltransferase [Rathayibacter sp. VKM Ac-2878]